MRHLTVLLVMFALLAPSCGQADTATGDGEQTPVAGAQTPATPAAEATETPAEATETPEESDGEGSTTIVVDSSDLGEVLVDGEGNLVYLFDNDEQGPPTCYDDCESSWPPVEGPASAGEGADDSLLGVVERDDGTQQATYGDWPLYYFAGDEQAGDTNGHGVGGVWWAVTPDGERAGEAEEGEDNASRDY